MLKCTNSVTLVSFLLCLSLEIYAGTAKNIIQNFDEKFYTPKSFGVNDLIFEMRITGLADELNKKSIYGKLNDVYFKFYWALGAEADVEVIGISGFDELKLELKRMALTRLDNVLPISLEERLKSYDLKLLNDKGEFIVIKATDSSYTKVISEIDLTFDKANRLHKMRVQQPVGQEFSEYKMSPKSWSKGKLVLDYISVVGLQNLRSETNIAYLEKEGLGFPQSLKTTTTQLLFDRDSSDKLERQVNTEVIFSAYEVNTGKAKHFLSTVNKIK